MSQENVEIARRGYAALNRGDLDAFLDLYAPDATLHPLAYWPDSLIRHGREEIRRLLVELREPWERSEATAEKLVEVGDCVVAEHVYRGVMKGTDDEMEWRLGMTLTFRGGKVTDVSFFRTFTDALEAAGLSE